jgi:hypothetical protein
MPTSRLQHHLRLRIADLLAEVESTHHGLEPAIAIAALVDTAFQAALTFSSSPDEANLRVHAALDALQRRAVKPPLPPPTARVLLVFSVTALAWITILFLGRRGTLSAWNFIGPGFCTALAITTLYRHLVDSARIRPFRFFFQREPRSQTPQLPPRLPE